MVADLQALLSPGGGDVRGRELETGAGLLTWLGADIAGSVFLPKAQKYLTSRYKSRMFPHTVKIGPQLPPGGARRAMRGSMLKRQLIAKESNILGKQIRRTKSLVSKMSSLLLVTTMFQLGVSLTKPGISTITKKREEELLADERPLDSAAAYTQRQRAIAAILDSQMSVRQVIGQEASLMHR